MFCFPKPSSKLLLWTDVPCLIVTFCGCFQTATYTLRYIYQRLKIALLHHRKALLQTEMKVPEPRSKFLITFYLYEMEKSSNI